MKLDRVVIGIDFSERSIAAALWIARSFAPNAELVLVHVLEVPSPPPFLVGRPGPREQLLARERSDIAYRLDALARQLGRGVVAQEIRVGRPDEEVARVAAEQRADLIVVGSHRDRAGLWNRLGSTAERIVSRASVPVLVVHGAPREAPRSVFAAVDDSPLSDVVSDIARVLTRRFGARGVVTHVLPPRLIHRVVRPGPATDVRAIQAEANMLEAARQWLADKLPDDRLDLSPAVMLGDPAETILLEAGRLGADLLVLGRARRAAMSRLLLGSVAGAVIRGARCPVLVVPALERRQAEDAFAEAQAGRQERRRSPNAAVESERPRA